MLGYVIRNYIPEMKIETLHFWLVMAGYFHTFFGQRGGQIDENADADQVITLEWDWGFRDTLYADTVLQWLLLLLVLLGNHFCGSVTSNTHTHTHTHTHTCRVHILLVRFCSAVYCCGALISALLHCAALCYSAKGAG